MCSGKSFHGLLHSTASSAKPLKSHLTVEGAATWCVEDLTRADKTKWALALATTLDISCAQCVKLPTVKALHKVGMGVVTH